MLTLAPNLGKNERGEFTHWLVYYTVSERANDSGAAYYSLHPESAAGRALAIKKSAYLNYVVLPWVWQGRPDVEVFHAMEALGVFRNLPSNWAAWKYWCLTLIRPDTEWVISTGVSDAAIGAAIQRKEIERNEST